jgi:hypothetical protein
MVEKVCVNITKLFLIGKGLERSKIPRIGGNLIFPSLKERVLKGKTLGFPFKED